MSWLDRLLKRVMYGSHTSVKTKHALAFLTRNSPRKLINWLRVEVSMRLGLTRNFGYPYLLAVEPTNHCNLRCPLCPTGQGQVGRPKQLVAFERYKQLIDQIGPYVYLLNLHNWGEPLLARETPRLVRYAHEKNVFTAISTNGNYPASLNTELVDGHLDYITFAVDGATQATYEKYRIGGNLELVLGNIRELLEIRRSRGVRYPFVELQFLVFDYNEHEIDEMRALGERLCVDGTLIRAANAPGNEANRKKYYTWNDTKGFCGRFWYTATVHSDGGVVPCCNYFDKKDDFGNAYETDFASVWNSDVYAHRRRVVAQRDTDNLDPICKSCKVYDQSQASYPIYAPATDQILSHPVRASVSSSKPS